MKKTISRQTKWQRKKHADGKCWICGKPVVDGWHCAKCKKIVRDNKRNAYRKSKGIPLDAPLYSRAVNA